MRLLFAGYLTLSTVKKYALQSWGRFAQLPWLPVACPQLIYQQTHPVPFFVRNLFFFALTFPLLSVACFPRGFLVVCLFVLFFRCRSGTAGDWRFLLLWKFARKATWTCFRNFVFLFVFRVSKNLLPSFTKLHSSTKTISSHRVAIVMLC